MKATHFNLGFDGLDYQTISSTKFALKNGDKQVIAQFKPENAIKVLGDDQVGSDYAS